jgi:hypothetical protein
MTEMNEEEVRALYDQELLLIDGELASFDEAAPEKSWMDAMNEEITSIKRNNTRSLTHLPKAIGLNWVFKLKKDAKGNVTKHKARLVAKGYV